MSAAGTGYLRFPSISGESVVFVCEDDLWRAPATGGRAERLTAGVAEAGHPHLSPDGTQLAFVGQEDGPEEVYVMPAAGGPARRLTYDGAGCAVVGWHGGAIQYASNAGRPFLKDFRLWSIDPAEGLPRPVAVGSARTISYGPAGGVVIGRHNGGNIALGRHNREPAMAKRYRGGTAGTLWVDASGSGEFVELSGLTGNLANPCWVGERIYFLSDYQGIGNVYSCLPDGSDVRRHTDHEEFYARNLAGDGTRLVYHCAGDVYLLDPAEDAPRGLDIELPGPATARNRKFVAAGEYLGDAALGPDGTDLTLTSRGKAFSMAHWEGPVRAHGEPDGVRYRLLTWLNDHERLVAAAADEGPDEYLVVLTAGEHRRVDLDVGRVVELAVNPCGDRGDLVAVANHRREILLVDLAEGSSLRVDHTDAPARPGDLAWSPDGRWLAYALPEHPNSSAIKVFDVDSSQSRRVTEPVLADTKPSWDPRGRYLYFLGQRHLDPVYDTVQFDLGFPLGCLPYAVTLRAGEPSPFVPLPRPVSGDTGDGAAREAGSVEIDFAGIEQRVVAFPVPLARYRRVAGLPGSVLLSSLPVRGSLDRNIVDVTAAPEAVLESFEPATGRTERLCEDISDFSVDAAGATMLLRAGRRLRVLPAGAKPADGGDAPGRETGWLDLDRLAVAVRPAAEWRQMFREAWRLQRDHYWDPEMAGVDWERVYRRYLPLVDRVRTRGELSDLLWEFHAELGTSHAYEMGGDYPDRPRYQQGHLGVDWSYDEAAGRFVIDRIVSGDPGDSTSTSPLTRPGVDARPRDAVVAINGTPIGRPGHLRLPGEALVNQASREIEVTLARQGVEPWTVTVRASTDERPARYRDWVDSNRALVRERTGGRVGYLHIPNMGPQGFAEFHRGFLAEYDRDALVVDVRFNGGGHVSPLLLEKLARRRTGHVISRWAAPQGIPRESPRGPLVALTNENAGSDGDIFSHRFKLLGLGPLIGKRTWGGVVGIAPSHALADSTVTTQPEFYMTYDDIGYDLENRGAEPDIEVGIAPEDYVAGRDPQLERAIAVALERLEDHEPHAPTREERPRLAAPSLPPRP
ncbi:PDZ domain-containing protein [Haloechinothrix sp. YIM 98757]|uniref:Tricorn protease homolog n=1 Tax=Haloechinothrix aidingensis TaxID=2752311 RepID=A0A838ACG8_9PSEU|nr:S41 family peptidase [Haloechinothrix aidingensis]MBA0126917.1 PDZ domain-containing protein [Haloechinothrix aidingensis]